MMQINKEIIINAPLKKAWSVFSNLEEWPEWSGFILKAYWTCPKKWAVDSTFTQVIKGIGLVKRTSHPKIIKIKLMHHVTWTGTGSLIKGVHTFKFEKINKKTKVINIEYFKGPLAPIIFPFIKNRFNTYFEQFLKGLKRKAENNERGELL